MAQANDFLLYLLLIENCLHGTKISKQQKGHSFEWPFFSFGKELVLDELDAAFFSVQKVDAAFKIAEVNAVVLSNQNDLTGGVHELVSLVGTKPVDLKNAIGRIRRNT
jgi:hypothetical protein